MWIILPWLIDRRVLTPVNKTGDLTRLKKLLAELSPYMVQSELPEAPQDFKAPQIQGDSSQPCCALLLPAWAVPGEALSGQQFHFPLSFPRELSPILQHSPGASGISQPIPWAGWPPQMGVIHLTEMVRDFLIILLSFLSAVSSGMGLVWAESLSVTNLLPFPLQFLLMLFWLSFALDLPYSSELRISLVDLFID